MSNKIIYIDSYGKEYREGDLVKLKFDDDFAEWNNLSLEKYGTLIGVITYKGLSHEDILAEVLVNGRKIPFDWDDIEVVNEER